MLRVTSSVLRRTVTPTTARSYFLLATTSETATNQAEHANLVRLASAYRACGHSAATTDPLGLAHTPASSIPELDPGLYGIDASSSEMVATDGIAFIPTADGSGFKENASVAEIVAHLKAAYTGDVGAEFHVPSAEERVWLAQRIEKMAGNAPVGADKKERLGALLVESEAFDAFMQKKFAFVKRYGLEGAEGMLPALEGMFEAATKDGKVEDVVIAMPHRGRLNFLTSLLELDPALIFGKLKGKSEIPDGVIGSGDVLSHLAVSVDLPYSNGARDAQGNDRDLHVSLIHNPSHLEHANPVALGKVRSRQRSANSMCLMLHGDAAFAGQGVVQESFMMSSLPEYATGGTVHLIVNNQLGFTATGAEYRSSRYSSDVGKVVCTPVLHVNGENPEAVYTAAQIAVDFRNTFGRDIILDMIAYRRRGHNELDEPAFTQPQMYSAIRSRDSLPKMYAAQLEADAVVAAGTFTSVAKAEEARLADALSTAESDEFTPPANHLAPGSKWEGMEQVENALLPVVTGVETEVLQTIGEASVSVPDSFQLHKRIERLYRKPRIKKVKAGENIDWATAETLAWGSLLKDGYNVRISGQDVGRGTFSHRHVYLYDQNSSDRVIPLNGMEEDQEAKLEVANSLLSEMAVLGFEYGYSMDDPKTLTIWEAQFGDFANGAQTIYDNFIASGEQKWLRQSGLVTMLPHGMDGAGPEHSSARIERFLQLCDGDIKCTSTNPNMFVANPSTPANYFHLLRRQMVRNFRKPLVIISPKTLLRLPEAVSTLAEMGEGTVFEPVLDDPTIADPSSVSKVLLCSGKVYYDLVKRREEEGVADSVAIVRIEELHPFPLDTVASVLDSYSNAEKYVYVQEEPANAGLWRFLDPRLRQVISSRKHLSYAGRPPCAAVAVSHAATHKAEVEEFMTKAFTL